MKSISKMTLEEFLQVPHRESFDKNIGEFNSLVLIPTDDIHDSGYRCMEFVACIEQDAIVRLSGCSDIVHVGKMLISKGEITPGWSIDCLPKSGLLRLYKIGLGKMVCGPDVSSFFVL